MAENTFDRFSVFFTRDTVFLDGTAFPLGQLKIWRSAENCRMRKYGGDLPHFKQSCNSLDTLVQSILK